MAETRTEQHTPGPWAADADGDECFWVTGPNRSEPVICDMVARNEDGSFTAEDDANAELIAAAPQMLSALRELRELADQHEVGAPDADAMSRAANRIKAIAGDAIENATGERP